MMRALHSLAGLVLGLLVAFLSVTGTLLALGPVAERLDARALPAVSVAQSAAAVLAAHPGAEALRLRPSGIAVLAYTQDDTPHEAVIDPATGAVLRPWAPSGTFLAISELHRSFLQGDGLAGRGLAGLGALGMVLILISGGGLLHHRMGGWRRMRARVKGAREQRLHILAARAALPGLAAAALTGVWLSATFLGVAPNDMGLRPDFPDTLDGGDPLPAADLQALQAIPLSDLKSLVFPFDADPFEPYEVLTRHGTGYVDPATGDMAAWLPHSPWRRAYETALMLHTGVGLWWFGAFLGLSALAVPLLAATGTAVWWHRRSARPRLRRNVDAAQADTVILVGSEGNTTWGFAQTLQDALSAAGHFVHLAPMNALSADHCGNRRMFILTATYGDGAAPGSARGFLDRLAALPDAPRQGVTVLGFGDREFDAFCAFAAEVETALKAHGWPVFHPMETVNRQSPQEFARWGDIIGPKIGADLRLVHIVETPPGQDIQLLSREVFGQAVDAPSVILRFALPPQAQRWPARRASGFAAFQAGDLLGVVPPGATLPRYYSIGSSSRDGFVEIAVRRHALGLCSGYLHDLQPQDRIRAFIRPNPEFHLSPGRSPVILVGAGCGIGPLAGFIRGNGLRRPMRLYFGARDPDSDFLYRRELTGWLAEGRLGALVTAFSRSDRLRLQDRIRDDAATLRDMVQAGAQVMIVGGRDMAQDVMAAFDQALAPTGITVARLRSEGRYVEDIF